MPEKWEQVKELFALAQERAPEERSDFLREACAGDDSLRAEIESLLSSFDGADTFLEDCPAADLLSEQSRAIAKKKIGAYRILREIGQGGMAVVYLGERDDQSYRKQVAIKMVKPGFDTEQILHRFRNERQTLAALDHFYIVKLLDGGSTEDGSPYLVMEYVEGLPLDQYCDLHTLSIDDRLRLFCQVCSAVQYAHENLVIHRDLKPGNILIAKGGVPRLLDFGIAKLLDPGLTQVPLETRTGWRPMTPEYASPEQIRGQAITTAADVYSLGILLFELLSGHRPYRAAGQSLLEMERLICEAEPERPSVVISRTEEKTSGDGGAPAVVTPESVSTQRGSHPAELRRRLRGDLDTIVMKAIRKEPESRYPSVEEFSRDIERSLTGMPVLARKPTIAYRGGRFLRRHKESLVTAMAALIFVATITVVAIPVATIVGTRHSLFHGPNPALTDKDTVVLADFTNTTGDSVFDEALKQALAVQLGQSPFLNILSERKVDETLGLMGRKPGDRVSAEVARQLCVRTGSKAIVSGSISSLGNEYVVAVSATACGSGDTLAQEQQEAGTKQDVLKALGKAASSLRGKLGESLASIEQFDVPVEATTGSLEALKAFSEGATLGHTKGDAEAIPFFKRAIELDPEFAVAYLYLGNAYGNLGHESLHVENVKKAYALSTRVSERERYKISALYYWLAGDLEQVSQVFKMWGRSYPQDLTPPADLAVIDVGLGQYDRAVTYTLEALRLEPNMTLAYANLAQCYLALNRLDDAKKAIEQAREHKLETDSTHLPEYELAFMTGDAGEMDRQVTWAAGKPRIEDPLLSFQSDTEAYYGRLGKARYFSRRAVDAAIRDNSKENAAMWQVNAALREGEFGNTAAAKRGAVAALTLAPARTDVKLLAALTLARIGESVRAKQIVKELEKDYPSDTLLRGYWLPTVNAALELSGGNSDRDLSERALLLLEPAIPYELGTPSQLQIGTLFPVYLRGQAQLMAHNGTAAAKEFSKFEDHRGVTVNFPLGALARLGLARAYALAGNTTKAKTAYRDFLALWKDADSDIPVLKQAKAEYARLQSPLHAAAAAD
jgi:serine/threonine protein kinase/tetratricopeptide (TPR) repeat protein